MTLVRRLGGPKRMKISPRPSQPGGLFHAEEASGRLDPLLVLRCAPRSHRSSASDRPRARTARAIAPARPACGSERYSILFGVAEEVPEAVILPGLAGREPRDELLLSREAYRAAREAKTSPREEQQYEKSFHIHETAAGTGVPPRTTGRPRRIHLRIEKSSDFVAVRKLRRSVTVTMNRNCPSQRFAGATEIRCGCVEPYPLVSNEELMTDGTSSRTGPLPASRAG